MSDQGHIGERGNGLVHVSDLAHSLQQIPKLYVLMLLVCSVIYCQTFDVGV